MTLPRQPVIAIKNKLNNAISLKHPHEIASAVDILTLTKTTGESRDNCDVGSHHREHLQVDGVEWSNVLNPLLDAFQAVQFVSSLLYRYLLVVHALRKLIWKWKETA